MRVFTLLSTLLCAIPATRAKVLNGTDPIVLTPLDGKTGTEKVLVIVNGAYISNVNYIDVAEAIQAASDLRLWVAIPSFLLDCPNPLEIGSKVSGAVDAIEAAGFNGDIDDGTDVIVAGHSLGGIFAQSEVVSGGYTGLILFGSYLTSSEGNAVDTYVKPVLTLAGELDGLTRITRIAQSWEEFSHLSDEDRYTHAVATLRGQSHSQFCSNVNVTSFGTKDLCPEVSWSVAHEAIGVAVDAFMNVVFGTSSETRAADEATLDAGMAVTAALVDGFIEAQALESGAWCVNAQEQEAVNISQSTLEYQDIPCSTSTGFDTTSPTIDEDTVSTVSFSEYALNPTDASTTDIAASELDCKGFTAEALALAFDESHVTSQTTCEGMNKVAISDAMALVDSVTLERYNQIGQPFVTAADNVCSSGITWKATSFSFSTSGDDVIVTSPRLTVSSTSSSGYAGNQLCKFLSPARVMEYMLVDGLPTFDEC